MDFSIEKVDPTMDWNRLDALERQIYRPADQFEPADWKDYECFVLKLRDQDIGALALRFNADLTDDDEFIAAPRTLFCGSIGVVPQYHRFGFGSLLLAAMITEARLRKCERIVSNIRESNTTSIALHQKFRFCSIRSILNFYDDPSEAAVIMELS